MKFPTHHRKSVWLAMLVFLAGRAAQVFANPTGLTVSTGQATAQQLGSRLNVTVSQLAILNWQSFNIGAGETTSFLQPSAGSVVFNFIGDKNPSQIFGNLNANGTVILANANGFYFGPNSMIKVGGSFIATTAPIAPDFGSGATWQFTGMPPLASIINYGQIEVGQGRSLFLIAENIENHGSLSAPAGGVGLLAGDSVLVSERPDGRGLSATVQMPNGSVDNFGRITADAGTIALQARVVNQNGVLQADSIQNQNGVIELVASDAVNLGANSQILARGDGSIGGSAGGTVTLKSENNFSDAVGSTIVTAGGVNGGNGGNVEVSAPNIQSLNTAMDASAKAGFIGGEFLLDPVNIILGTSGAGVPDGSGTVAYNSGSGTLNINVNTAFKNKNFSNIKLQATGNITLNASTVWDLSTTTGQTTGQLTLQAGGNIIFGNSAKITDANNWSVTLQAGYSFVNNTVVSGGGTILGNIYLNGGAGQSVGGTIQLAAGNLNLFAGQSILIGSGSAFTTGGGNIFAYALAGDINAGTSNGGTSSTSQTSDYNFTDSGYTINPVLGGISTAAGGNVTLIAGNNIDSTPKIPRAQSPGASGTYGSGDVTVIAGNQITGNYNLANGVGTMIAGVPVQGAQASALQNRAANPSAYATTLAGLVTAVKASQNVNGNIGTAPLSGNPSTAPVTLSVIKGAWNAYAANDISIKEVNNPNGAFNTSQSFLFDYAPDAAANFWAGNAIELIGANLGRLTSVNRTPIYAPILSLNAGAGGIKIDKSILLAPSSQGSLSIVTRNGGNLNGAVVAGSTVLNGITMSDSASSDYTTFSTEHDNIHLPDANAQPVFLDISGNINSFSLTVPTFADITVRGDTYNFGFKGRNLSAAQTTSINVLGAITYRGNLTDIQLTPAQLADLLPARLFADSADLSVTSKLRYDPTTGQLIYVGVMSATDLAFLLNPTVIIRDAAGNPVTEILRDANGHLILDENGNEQIVTKTETLSLDATQQGLINQLYAATQDASLGDQGLALAGPGAFNVTANRIDLGVSGGIRVIAPDAGLATISPYGANLNVTTLGDLSMTSTKIANESYLGAVNVNVGGTLNIGGQFTTLGDASAPKGIFSTSGGDVSVVANGDVNVNGSRIAAYDGGNITVRSQNGDINAGTGGAGYVSMNALELNPLTGQLVSIAASIAGSGILATTVVGSHATLGNILLSAPNGDITASKGGILQISFNGHGNLSSAIAGLAGYLLRDANGNIVTASGLNLAPPASPAFGVSLGAVENGDKPRTVVVGLDRFQVSKAVWAELVAKLGVTPGKKQVIDITGLATKAEFLAALSGNTGSSVIPIVQGALAAAASGDLANTVVLGSQRIQVSDTVWAQLNSLLGLAPGNNQVIKLNVSGDSADLAAYLLGTSSDLSKFNFATLTSPDRNIEASGSGVIGNNINLLASGKIDGVVIGNQNVNVNAQQNINVTAIGGGNVSVNSASGTVAGTIVGGGEVSVSGDAIIAAVMGSSVSASGDTSGASLGIPTSNVAKEVTETTDSATATQSSSTDDELKKKKGVSLAQKVGRVTVVLPAAKKLSETMSLNPKL